MGSRKLEIIRTFDGSFTIIEIVESKWYEVSGPYLSREEALPDLRILQKQIGR